MSGANRRGPPDITGMFSVKVDNLTYETTPSQLRLAFSRVGDVGDVYIPTDRMARSKGYAFVRFLNQNDARYAYMYYNGTMLNGRPLRISMSRYGKPPHITCRTSQIRRQYREHGIVRERFRSRSPRGDESASESASNSSIGSQQKAANSRSPSQSPEPQGAD